MKIVLVVAMAENRVIGRAGGLPWRLSGDLKYFKRVTLGRPVIMGRKTWTSIGKPLPERRNIVVTRNVAFRAEGAEIAPSLDAAFDLCRDASAEAAMVIGGGEIYAQALARADRIHLTEVHRSVEGDTLFPDLDAAEWREVDRDPQPAESSDGPTYTFVVLDRVAGSRDH